jgi:UDP-glucuronate decarboxylase
MTNQLEIDAHYLSENLSAKHFSSMNILLTGASGLLGLNILMFLDTVLKYQNIHFRVLAISKTLPSIKRDWHPSILFRAENLIDLEFSKFKEKFNMVIHAATYGQPSKFIVQSRETLYLNGPVVLGLLSVLERGGKFVYLSTSEVYFGSQKVPYSESDIGQMLVDHDRSAYYYGKLFGEVAALKYSQDIVPRILRVSLCYGPGTKLDDQRVMNEFIRSACLKGEIRLIDQGQAVRNYCYVRDFAEMMYRIVSDGSKNVYNVCGNSETNVADLARLIGEFIGAQVIFPQDNDNALSAPEKVNVSAERYGVEFPFPKFIDLREGLKRTIEWQKEYLYGTT